MLEFISVSKDKYWETHFVSHRYFNRMESRRGNGDLSKLKKLTSILLHEICKRIMLNAHYNNWLLILKFRGMDTLSFAGETILVASCLSFCRSATFKNVVFSKRKVCASWGANFPFLFIVDHKWPWRQKQLPFLWFHLYIWLFFWPVNPAIPTSPFMM